MRTSVKILVLVFALYLPGIGCRHRVTHQSIAQLRGSWLFDLAKADGSSLRTKTTIEADGKYHCQTTAKVPAKGLFEFRLEGTFQIRDGFLIDTVTKHSDTNFAVPWTVHARIVRMTDREFVINDDLRAADAVFRKIEE